MDETEATEILHIRSENYTKRPWKNGLGTTQNILMLPEGADDDTFDLRIALTPIVEDAIFSSFENIDRVITVIEGEALELEFDGKKETLKQYESLQFDSGLTPMGRPARGVKVINVMARHQHWKIEMCDIMQDLEAQQGIQHLSIFVPLNSGWVCWVDDKKIKPTALDTIAIFGPASVWAGCQNGLCLFARLCQRAKE